MVSVLRRICANQHGLFWAGDTAQVMELILYRRLTNNSLDYLNGQLFSVY